MLLKMNQRRHCLLYFGSQHDEMESDYYVIIYGSGFLFHRVLYSLDVDYNVYNSDLRLNIIMTFVEVDHITKCCC